jgi:hypothetical protein
MADSMNTSSPKMNAYPIPVDRETKPRYRPRLALGWCVAWLLSVSALHGQEADTPAWATQPALRRLRLDADPRRTAEQNGLALVKATQALVPGDQLVIGPGTYSVAPRWDISAAGTAEAPIRIVAAEEGGVRLTRPDAKQNVLNVGFDRPTSYLLLQGLEITGGSHGLRLGQCHQVWIDNCHIHHTGGVCLSANSFDTHHLYLTRNHLHHGGGHGEGMYLGGNEASVIMSESVIARNHVHDCRGEQGDGIEVKQGSWGNLITQNHVHDCNYPCITVYGTQGRAPNTIERNRCYRSQDNVMQVQGEAIVRNNVLIGGRGSGFSTTDHQGRSRSLVVVHNTIVNIGHAFSGRSWDNREGMVLANNLLYSREGMAMHFPHGQAGATIVGNVIYGEENRVGVKATSSSNQGRGLQDFQAVSWDATLTEAIPAPGAPFAQADPRWVPLEDFTGRPRQGSLFAGAWLPEK